MTKSGAEGHPGPGDVGSPAPDLPALYVLLADRSRDVVLFVRREDGRILEANAAAARAYGWTREELRTLRITDLRAPETLAATSAQMAEADTQGLRFQTVHLRKDGSAFPVEVSSDGATVDGHRILVSVVRDISPQRAAEAALRESEDRLALAMEAAGLGMFFAVPFGPLHWSARCREIFGVGDAEIPDFEAFLRLVHPADREQVREAAARWLDPAGDGRYKDQYRCLRPDGSIRWVAASGIARMKEVDGVLVPAQLVGTIFDITEQKVAQEQLMLADRLASVGTLAASVAHEINNPLSYLMGALEFLADRAGGADADTALALADAREGALRVRQVVRDLRALSGTQEERRSAAPIRPAVESAMRLAAKEIGARATLRTELGEAPAVVADEARIGQVVLNLLVNAAQAIPAGSPDRHEVRLALGTDASGWATIEVSDTGPGVPPALAERIFDPFFSTKPRGTGTGLGLAICRSIVTQSGGEIALEPRPGGGATFRVRLPPAPATAAAGPRQAAATTGRQGARRGRILVVDDEPAVGISLQRLLAGEHDVTVRTRAEDALAAVARGERFDAILFDLMMPGMSGMQLHAEVARIAPEQADRMVVITGGAFSQAAREFLASARVPIAEKPFDVPTLREILRRLTE